MRHDHIDPGESPDAERPALVSTEERICRFGPRLDVLEERSLETLSEGEAEGPDAESARLHAINELAEIAACRARLRQGIFGMCETCGRAIPLSRLEAVPTARSCVACQAKTEARK